MCHSGALGDDDAVDEDARDFHLARVQRAGFGDALDLGDDDAAAVARGHGDGLALKGEGFLLHGDVAVLVGGGAADDADADREGLVEKVFLAVDLHHAHQVPGGAAVDLAAAEARVDEGAEADPGDGAGLAGGDVAVQVGDDALGQVVGLDAVGHGEFLQARDETPVAADDAGDEAFMAEVVEAAVLAVALTGTVDEGQAFGLAAAVGVLVAGFKEALLERDGDVLGKADADEAGGGHGVAGADQFDGVGGADDLAGVAALGAHELLLVLAHGFLSCCVPRGP